MATAPEQRRVDDEGTAVAAFLAGLITSSVAEYRRDGLLQASVERVEPLRTGGFSLLVRTASGLRVNVEVFDVVGS